MKTLRIAQAALATILAVGINSTSHAFMAAPADQPATVQMNLTDMVDSFRQEIAAGQTSCDDMLAKLDSALADIDAQLDAGVTNEAEYLTARDAIAKMRYDLECFAKELTHDVLDANGNPLAHAHLQGDMTPGSMGVDGSFAPGADFSGGGGGGGNGGGGGGGGGGVSGGAAGGSGLGGLAALGILGGGIAAVASDDSTPGFVASPSVSN